MKATPHCQTPDNVWPYGSPSHFPSPFPKTVAAGAPSLLLAQFNRPDIRFIQTDDQRFDDLGCYGNTVIKTPHIDQLARDGVLFRSHFVTTAICCCSGASGLTGHYMRRHGSTDFATSLSAAQFAETYPAMLRRQGYRTAFLGKYASLNCKDPHRPRNYMDPDRPNLYEDVAVTLPNSYTRQALPAFLRNSLNGTENGQWLADPEKEFRRRTHLLPSRHRLRRCRWPHHGSPWLIRSDSKHRRHLHLRQRLDARGSRALG